MSFLSEWGRKRRGGRCSCLAAHTMSWGRSGQAWGGGGGGAAICAAVAYGTSGWKGLNCCWTAFRATGDTARVGVALAEDCSEVSADTAQVQRAHAALWVAA